MRERKKDGVKGTQIVREKDRLTKSGRKKREKERVRKVDRDTERYKER